MTTYLSCTKSVSLQKWLCLFVLATSVPLALPSQSKESPQITQSIDESKRVTLYGNTHPLAKPEYDEGVLPDSAPARRLLLVLHRSPEHEAALRQYIDEIHNAASPNYHHWRTPQEVGLLYGPSQSDLEQVGHWLESHGFSVDRVHPSKMLIEFSGDMGQIREAFHTEIHRYDVDGELHNGNDRDPQIPEALAPVVAGVASLNDFQPRAASVSNDVVMYSPTTGIVTPLWTYPTNANGGLRFYLDPGDFKIQYDVGNQYTGTGRTIGIIGLSNVNINLVNAYRSLFGLPANPPQVVIDGADPGQFGEDAEESYLDLEAAGSVAPGATILLYTSASAELTVGMDTAAQRAVDDNAADVLSMSYIDCEKSLGTRNLFYSQLWQQAAAQGQTVMVSAGDGGPDSCDNHRTATIATSGLSVNGFASTPYNVAVGGTDFYYSSSTMLGTYWNQAPSIKPSISIQDAPIPEQAWNDPLGQNLDSKQYSIGVGIQAGSGGPSSCISQTSAGNCGGAYSRPSWQVGPGLSGVTNRELPDVSLFASGGANYSSWPICAAPGDCTTNVSSTGAVQISSSGGTSAASPAFAGIMAMVDQATGSRQGQANYVLYAVAAQFPSSFHDITQGSNKVPCTQGLTGCVFDPAYKLYDFGYDAAVGYDMATGLGSIDVTQLIANWSKIKFDPTTTLLSIKPWQITHGQSVNINVTVQSNAGGASPSGSIALTSSALGAVIPAGAGTISLAEGSANTTLQSLPGGAYTIAADYSGDGVHAPSHSATQVVRVTPEPSSIQFWSGDSIYINSVSSYTRPFVAQVKSTSGSTVAPTGTVTFTDSAGGQATIALSSSGANGTTGTAATDATAQWSPSTLALGAHTISAVYSGDASYSPSATLAVLSFTLAKVSPRFLLVPSNTILVPGSSLTAQLYLSSPYAGSAGPSGMATFSLGAQQQIVQLTPIAGQGGPASLASATFNNLAAGAYSLSANYSGDAYWSTVSPETGITVASSSSLAPSTTTLTTSSSAPVTTGGSDIVLTPRVQGNAAVSPSGTVSIYDNGAFIASETIGSNGSLGSIEVYGSSLTNGANELVAAYSGDHNYSPSNSANKPLVITAAFNDFSLIALPSVLNIVSGKSGTANFGIASLGTGGAVTIQCTTSSAAISCTPDNPTVTLPPSGQVAASVTITSMPKATSNSSQLRQVVSWQRGGLALSCLILLGLSRMRRITKSLLGLILITLGALSISGCSTYHTETIGAYSVLVTATSGGVTHDVKVTVNVE